MPCKRVACIYSSSGFPQRSTQRSFLTPQWSAQRALCRRADNVSFATSEMPSNANRGSRCQAAHTSLFLTFAFPQRHLSDAQWPRRTRSSACMVARSLGPSRYSLAVHTRSRTLTCQPQTTILLSKNSAIGFPFIMVFPTPWRSASLCPLLSPPHIKCFFATNLSNLPAPAKSDSLSSPSSPFNRLFSVNNAYPS